MNETLHYYNDHAQAYVDDTVHLDMGRLHAMFQRYVKPGAAILDFGCGSGRDIKYFSGLGYRVDAIDGSEELCRIASEYSGQPVRHMLFQELEAIEQYDGIWACSSILHVPKPELPDVLSRIHRALVPGGYLYTSFKYGDFSGTRNGRYFSYFTVESLAALLTGIPGLAIVETTVTTDVRPGREEETWLNVILQKRAPSLPEHP